MPKPRTEASDPDLYESIQQFGQQIAALTDAVERLCDELQWRNNERRKDGERSPPPFVLHSMPVDPTTDGWQLNRARPEAILAQFERDSVDSAQSSTRQRHLFDEGETDADRSDE